MSYRSDCGRIPRLREFGHQARNASTPTIATQPSSYGSATAQYSRPQIPRLMTPSTKTRTRAASMSEAEENRPIVAQSNPILTPDSRPYMPPRLPTHPADLQNSTLDGHVPRALHTPAVPQTPINNLPPVQSRPRKVLRRKAPTIGQHSANNKLQAESTRPSGLNVIIPNSTALDQPQLGSSQSSSQTELARQTPSPMVAPDQPTAPVTEQQAHHGPKELASLRTTVNTQNLPPFTPIFPSASTPSTRYSGSPGIWSRTSASTPASLSSCSPGITQPMKVGPRLRQPSPSHTRLPVFSPQGQKPGLPSSPASGKTRSPNLAPGYGSATSLLTDNREDSSEAFEATRSPPPAPSLLPRRTSTKSSIPRQVKDNTESHQPPEKTENSQLPELSDILGKRTIPKPSGKIPVRPSREGTEQLHLEPSPVVKTNIPPRAIKGHRRRISAGSSTGLASNQSAATSVDSLNSTASSQIRSPSSPELARKSPKTLTKEPRKTTAPDSSPVKTRKFGLFPRKSKPELDAGQNEARPVRKGPAAGTGHEGYGKYGQRGRKSSVGSTTDARARSTSTTKSASSKGSGRSRADTELDDFFLARLEPVYLNGGGVDGATLSRTQSEQSAGELSTKSAPGPSHAPVPPAGYHYEPTQVSTRASTFKESHRRDLSSPATISASKGQSKTATLASPEKSKTRPDVQTTQISSRKKESDSHAPPQTQSKKPSKRGLNMKWPFFHKDVAPAVPDPKPPSKLPAQVATHGNRRPVAHYALVDTDSDPLEEIFYNLEDSPPTEETEDSDQMPPVEVPDGLRIRKQHESVLLPSPPKLHSEYAVTKSASPNVGSPKETMYTRQEPSPEERPSRLASVGRIPRVVSRKDRQHRPAVQSFSRPFSVAEDPSSLAAIAPDQPHGHPGPSGNAQGQPLDMHRKPGNTGFDLTSPFSDPMKGSALDFLAGPYSNNEFLSFSPPRKDSLFSTSSGSESLAAITAVVPGPETELMEDEIWGEYDEFIDHVLSPETPNLPFPGGLEPREKFELAARASRALQAGLNSSLAVPASSPEQPTVSLTPASPRGSVNSVRLRRSKIANALHASLSPTSQPSVSDMMARFRDDHEEVPTPYYNTDVQPPVITVEDPQPSIVSSPSLDPSPSFENCRQRNTILFDIAERDREGPTAQTNIRSGSLMTSRWLSFGRVLFSPAHNHVREGVQKRILVVDGLGNDDWSFYCALTYPNSDVYCLHEGPIHPASTHPAAWQPPSNHHTIHHASLENPVPFPKGFFAATVLRFPAACSEAAQNNIISECKRVLRPGGYLEMSILDHDMVNMGVRTRRAVRKLKETMYLSDASISLKPASDNIQKLLGSHGFDNLRRCMVRIPVAGMIVRSSASSSSTTCSNPSTLTTAAITSSTALSAASGSSEGQRSNMHEKSSSNDTVLSLGDLLSDPSPSPSNDESIRKIVARVGRWWYTRCYESPVLPNGDVDRSLWANKKILRECQQRGTGFRLLIAYTQKPSEKRRTASV